MSTPYREAVSFNGERVKCCIVGAKRVSQPEAEMYGHEMLMSTRGVRTNLRLQHFPPASSVSTNASYSPGQSS
jgi:hypothetical protein